MSSGNRRLPAVCLLANFLVLGFSAVSANAQGRPDIVWIAAWHIDVYCAALSPDGQMLASGGWDRTIKLWNVSSGSLIRTLTGHTSGVWSVAFSPDGQALASGSDDNTIKLWNVSDGSRLQTYDQEIVYVHSIQFSPDGRLFAYGRFDATVAVARNPFAAPRGDANKVAHYMLRWLNTRGDKGPWSETASATIGA